MLARNALFTEWRAPLRLALCASGRLTDGSTVGPDPVLWATDLTPLRAEARAWRVRLRLRFLNPRVPFVGADLFSWQPCCARRPRRRCSRPRDGSWRRIRLRPASLAS